MKRIKDFLNGISERGLRQFYKEPLNELENKIFIGEGHVLELYRDVITTERYLRSLIGATTNNNSFVIDNYIVCSNNSNTVTSFILIKNKLNEKQ